jgi:hypothetical protein
LAVVRFEVVTKKDVTRAVVLSDIVRPKAE